MQTENGRMSGDDDSSAGADEMGTDAKKQERPSPDAKKQERSFPDAKKQE
jgi:hypothetical protein